MEASQKRLVAMLPEEWVVVVVLTKARVDVEPARVRLTSAIVLEGLMGSLTRGCLAAAITLECLDVDVARE